MHNLVILGHLKILARTCLGKKGCRVITLDTKHTLEKFTKNEIWY